MAKRTELERVWQRADRRRSEHRWADWLERQIREDPLGVRIKSITAIVAGAVFLAFALLASRWLLAAFGLVVLALGLLTLDHWSRYQRR